MNIMSKSKKAKTACPNNTTRNPMVNDVRERRLMKELQDVTNNATTFTVDLVNDNLFEWHVSLNSSCRVIDFCWSVQARRVYKGTWHSLNFQNNVRWSHSDCDGRYIILSHVFSNCRDPTCKISAQNFQYLSVGMEVFPQRNVAWNSTGKLLLVCTQ